MAPLSASSHFAYSTLSAVTGAAKSYAESASVLPPSELSNQPTNVLSALAGSVTGFTAAAPLATVCASGTGVPPSALKLTVNEAFSGALPIDVNFQLLDFTMFWANVAAAVPS